MPSATTALSTHPAIVASPRNRTWHVWFVLGLVERCRRRRIGPIGLLVDRRRWRLGSWGDRRGERDRRGEVDDRLGGWRRDGVLVDILVEKHARPRSMQCAPPCSTSTERSTPRDRKSSVNGYSTIHKPPNASTTNGPTTSSAFVRSSPPTTSTRSPARTVDPDHGRSRHDPATAGSLPAGLSTERPCHSTGRSVGSDT